MSHIQESPRFTGISSFFRSCVCEEPSMWDQLDIGIVGVPFDGGTTNRPGTRFGPREVRNQSTLIAPWNPATNINPFELCRIADVGDFWVRKPFESVESCLLEISEQFDRMRDSGMLPISVGGDHSISLPILRTLGRERAVAMIHIDAHCDTGMGYMGSKYHHGAPFARAVEERLLDPGLVVQIGIRGPLNADIWRFSRETGMRVIPMEEVCRQGLKAVMEETRSLICDHPCYVSFDIDALDPAFAPGTGTPVVGGFTSREAIEIIRSLRGLNMVGADIVEVCPPFDPTGTTGLVAATILFELLCVLAESTAQRKQVAHRENLR